MNISVESVTDLQTNEGTARMHVHFVPNILDINTVRNTARTRAGRRKELGLVVLLVREGSSSLKPMMLDATRTPCRCNGRRRCGVEAEQQQSQPHDAGCNQHAAAAMVGA